ncbi:2-(1,2-epoxy-1,2-dihydrophenyl)acetyl-CoA isomerase [Virgibacillus dokdonensis]|uniref:2-(1,2-epoxy-1,2-dihydrophenyl)acetyl-CoA isomerase n=1 Tax=Virgibacillus dokdonensis TaxID=302167 RepID=A0A3E0WP78_9BACI|nr:enoyl-CoA hydratase-related protein [Virgibacillus dokdonensis]RFA34752.1 2-(1,2-epoxy-1,2-dihydrophenyl)acetyl-CoA isomerase [Virgibacillus dokdonensis]
MFQTIYYEEKDQVAWLTLNRPEKLNAFTSTMNQEMIEVFQSVGKNHKIRALVITGAGKAFCSGEDISSLQPDMQLGEIIKSRYQPMMKELARVEKPIIASINGATAGAGLSLAMACDFRIASEQASFMEAFIHIGLIPDSGNLYYLPRIVGLAKALELAILGEKLTAKEAKEVGLVTKVVPPDQLEAETTSFVDRLAHMPTKAIGLIKRYMYQSFETNLTKMLDYEAFGQEIAGKTEDYAEGVQSFLDKRSPKYKGY